MFYVDGPHNVAGRVRCFRAFVDVLNLKSKAIVVKNAYLQLD